MNEVATSSVKDAAKEVGLPAGVMSFEDVAKALHCSERWVFHLCNENKLHKAFYPQRKRAMGVLADSLIDYLSE